MTVSASPALNSIALYESVDDRFLCEGWTVFGAVLCVNVWDGGACWRMCGGGVFVCVWERGASLCDPQIELSHL